MKIERALKACINGISNIQQIYYLLDQTRLEKKNSEFQFGLERQKYVAGKIISSPMLAKYSDRCSMWLEYVCLYYRNKPKRLLPKWLENYRAKLFYEKVLPVEALSFNQLLAEGWTADDVVVSSMLLSSENIEGYHFEESTVNHWVSLRKRGQPFFLSLIFAGDMVGQWALTLLDENEFDSLLRGELNEEGIRGKKFEGAGKYYGYISTVSVSHKFRNQRAVGLLLKSVGNLLHTNQSQGVIFSGLVANAYTTAGEKLCSKFGMNFVVDDSEHGKIYYADEQSIYNSKYIKRGSFVNAYQFNE